MGTWEPLEHKIQPQLDQAAPVARRSSLRPLTETVIWVTISVQGLVGKHRVQRFEPNHRTR